MNQASVPLHTQQVQPEEVHISDYINVIYRRRRTFLIAFLVVFLGIALYTFITKPVYEASATLHVKDDKAKAGILGELSLGNVSPVDAEIEIIKSRSNAEQVVKRLHLDWQVSKKSAGLSFKLLEFNSQSEKPVYELEVTGADTFSVRDSAGDSIGIGRSGTLFQAKGLSLLVNDLKGKPGDDCTITLFGFNDTVDELRKKIKAVEVGKKTNIIRITSTGTDPFQTREVVNTLVQAYLDKTIALKAEEASRTVEFVQEQLKGVRQDLNKAETDLQEYKSSAGVIRLDTEAEELIKKFSDTEKERAAVSLQKKQMEFAITSLKDAARRGAPYSPALMREDPLVGGMATKLADLEVQKRALLSEYTNNHPAVKAMQGQIEELQQKIRGTYETAVKNLAKQDGEITKRLATYEGALKHLPATERDLARFMRVAKVNADIYTFLLQKHEEARIVQASTISNINIVDPAITPDRPIKPQKKKNLFLGLLLGCMVGVGLAFFLDYLDDTLKDADDIKRFLGLSVLGIIPHLQHKGEGDSALSETLITHHDPKASASEAFRSLRTALHFSSVGRSSQCILLTSSFPGEGKSTISSNLAIIQAQTEARVILIGCDLRRPSIHRMFKSERSPGLTEVLAGDLEIDAVIRSDSGVGVDYISAGVLPPNPAELLGSDKMREVIESLRNQYDYIILDAPPLLAVTDAQVITPLVDLLVVVIEAGRVPRKAGQHLKELLNASSVPIAGAIINDKSGKGLEYYGNYGYSYYGGYGYGNYGEEDHAAKTSLWQRIAGKATRDGKY